MQVLILRVCIYLCTGATTKTTSLSWSCLLEASVHWLPPTRQHHTATNTPDWTLSSLVTTHDHLCNPSMYIDQDTTDEPDSRLRVNATGMSAQIMRHTQLEGPALRHKCSLKACSSTPDATSQCRTTAATPPTPLTRFACACDTSYHVSARLCGAPPKTQPLPTYINTAIYLEETQ